MLEGNGKEQLLEIVRELASNAALQVGVELVDVELKGSRGRPHLVVYIDKPGGVFLDDCEKVNRLLGDLLDIEDPIPTSYVLEVSSPGIERALKKREDFYRFKGNHVKVKTFGKINGRKFFAGVLSEVKDESIIIAENEKEFEVPFKEICKANLWSK